MRILIIGPKSEENISLVNAGQKRNHQVKLVSLHQISLLVQANKMKAYVSGQELADYDVCLFRGISPYFAKAKTVANFLKLRGTEVFDRKIYSKAFGYGKMFMTFEFFQKGLPCIDTFHFSTFEELNKYLVKIPRPVLIKDIAGMHSRNIYSFQTKKGLEQFFLKRKKKVKQFLIQKKLNANYYYRVLVVGDKVLGSMKRMSYFNPQRKSTPLAKRSVRVEKNKEIESLALQAARATHTDIAGVDIIYDGDNPKIQEVNRSPKFGRFTEVMNVDVAQEIIKYLEKFNKI